MQTTDNDYAARTRANVSTMNATNISNANIKKLSEQYDDGDDFPLKRK